MSVTIYGDQTVRGLDFFDIDDPEICVINFGKTTIADFLETFNNRREFFKGVDSSIRFYSFGYNDIKNGRSNFDLISDFEKLPHGDKSTYIILPSNCDLDLYDMLNECLGDDVQFIFTIYDNTQMSQEECMILLKNQILEVLKEKDKA